ncbi:hypothetical protein PNOK_0716300 [Pyrrhoderma noxium]|uniref:Uncharacterized protein n=1 Tax=Pyrrhoderma noxium TaxID=2282107 RepID=A0A286UC26_9AGAM|nr:hypothetical protein PNOK_0716300 [Pyrrhoderma noxium]
MLVHLSYYGQWRLNLSANICYVIFCIKELPFFQDPLSNVLSQPNNPTTLTWPRYYEAHQRQSERTTQRASALSHLNKNIRYKQYAASGHLHCGCPTIKIILNEPIMYNVDFHNPD